MTRPFTPSPMGHGTILRTSRGGRGRYYQSAADAYRWDLLPYGCWTCADGREVLFSRHYEPLFEARPGEPVRPADPCEWVRWQRQEWFYKDGTPNKVRVASDALARWRARFEGAQS